MLPNDSKIKGLWAKILPRAKAWWEKFLLKIKITWDKLLHQEATPSHIALGFSLGFFLSFLPIFPLATPLGLALAYLLRSNRVAMLTGLHFHVLVFPVIPLVFIFEFKLGKAILHLRGGVSQEFERELERGGLLDLINRGWDILEATFLGALIIGIPCAIISYFIVLSAAKRWKKLKASKTPSSTELPKI